MLKKVEPISIDFSQKGLNTNPDIFSLQPGESPGCMNVDFDMTTTKKRLGFSSMNTVVMEITGGDGMMDFGVGATPQDRRLLCASGTGLYYSTDVGKTWVNCHSGRTINLNSFAFIKNYAINCNDSYDPPLYWAGSAATNFEFIANLSAPLCKYTISHQGFAFLLNEQNNKRDVYYVDQNDMFTKASWSHFPLPSDRNDEITGAFILEKFLYVSTKYKLFRLSFVGGNPDWAYKEVKGWGFVPRTFKKVQISEAGEVVIGLDWTKRIRVFNGDQDEIISGRIEKDNDITNFYLKKLNINFIDKSWAENDAKEQVYRLYLYYADSTKHTHCINFNYRDKIFYPYDNQNFSAGIMAQDTAYNLHMLVYNRTDGRIYCIDSGNRDVKTGINDYYESNFLYKDIPGVVSKVQKVNLYFSITSSGTLYYEDRNDFSNVWNLRNSFDLVSELSAVQTSQTIDIPTITNTYQFKISSSANTADPWKLNRVEYFQTARGIGKH